MTIQILIKITILFIKIKLITCILFVCLKPKHNTTEDYNIFIKYPKIIFYNVSYFHISNFRFKIFHKTIIHHKNLQYQ